MVKCTRSPKTPKVHSWKEVHREKWLGLSQINWEDNKGRHRVWEAVTRTTKQTGVVDAVDIIAIVRKDGEEDRIVIISQFRPPTEKVCLEIPSGLVDAGETAEQAALRELKEETGYRGTVVGVSPDTCYEPGLTSATCAVVQVLIDGNLEENIHPVPEMEDGECIATRLVPLSQLLVTLNRLMREEGMTVDAKVWTLACGLNFAQSFPPRP